MYTTIFNTTSSLTSHGGPSPKHHQPDTLSTIYPVFVLNIECKLASFTSFNVNNEGDGELIFHNKIDLVKCLKASLIPVFYHHTPQFLWILENNSSVFGSQNLALSNDMVTSIAKKTESVQGTCLITNSQEQTRLSSFDCWTNENKCSPLQKTQVDLLFQFGFLDNKPSTTDNNVSFNRDFRSGEVKLLDETKRHGITVSRNVGKCEGVGESMMEWLLTNDKSGCYEREQTHLPFLDCNKPFEESEEEVISLPPTDLDLPFLDCNEPFEESEEEEVRSLSPTDLVLWTDEPLGYSCRLPSDRIISDSNSLSDNCGLENSFSFGGDVIDVDGGEFVAADVAHLSYTSSWDSRKFIKRTRGGENNSIAGAVEYLVDNNLDSDFSSLSSTLPTHGAQVLRTEQVSLSKASIAIDLEVLAQIENKFIIALSNNQVLAVDQHAIHERILLEQYRVRLQNELPIVRHVVVNASQNEKLVDSRRVKFIESSHTLLSTWGFQYFNIQKSEQVIEMSLLKFHKLPLVENEALSVDDFIEFMEYSEHHIQLPDHLKAPPAVQRILASKSCRTAVKFGDTLTMKQCSNLLGDVVQCANPFQCAHGRPSIVPLISLANPKKQNARKRLLLNGRAKHLK